MPEHKLSSRGVAGRIIFLTVAAFLLIYIVAGTSDKKVVANSTETETLQNAPHGVFRGVKTAERFDISPPLSSLKNTRTREERERDEFEDRRTGYEGPLGKQDVDDV